VSMLFLIFGHSVIMNSFLRPADACAALRKKAQKGKIDLEGNIYSNSSIFCPDAAYK
jgi:hypothetical protein